MACFKSQKCTFITTCTQMSLNVPSTDPLFCSYSKVKSVFSPELRQNTSNGELLTKGCGIPLSTFRISLPPPVALRSQRGPWPPHAWGFLISHNYAPQSVGLLWTSDQLVAETSTWQHTTLTTDIHAPGGIRTHNLSRRGAVDLRLRPRSHWDRHLAKIIT